MSDQPEPLQQPADAAEPHWEAVARHVAGESDAAESAAVGAWLASHPEDARLVAIVKSRTSVVEARAERVPADMEGALARVRGRIAADEAAPTLQVVRGGAGPIAVRPRQRRAALWMAAVAAGLAAVAVLGTLRNTDSATGSEAGASSTTYRTARGARDSLRLPDGTTVVLAPGSGLQLLPGYGTAARAVRLTGAAYFVVNRDDARPFTVHTAAAVVRDLGTAFTVRTWGDSGVAVQVTEGLVAVESPGDATAVELRAGDRAVLQGGTVRVTRGVVTTEDIAWTRGVLTYRDAPLVDVAHEVGQWYGLTVQLSPALAARTLTATLPGDAAAQAIRVIALALGASVEQRGDTVTLREDARPMP
jgi:transmembrane sensor